ncbi:MAG TPA: ATP-binding cassette domain-containing protein, partial [Acidimicrobiales bacterium]|nr:ATP-binding cassette domain-containing protein [Acidimicrobiales bacterium]
GSYALDTERRYYVFALVMLLLCSWVAHNVWRGGVGRRLRALRDNEQAARAFTVPATRVRLQTFAVAGAVAGLGGATFGHVLTQAFARDFAVAANVDAVALTLVGGIGWLAGPIIGAFYIIGVPRFLPLDSAGLAASALGWLILILYLPGGIVQVIAPLRTRLVSLLGPRAQPEGEPAPAEDRPVPRLATRPAHDEARAGSVLLETEGLAKHYGGIHAVDGVSVSVASGEILGLIGPNGAGKTTLFELMAGFTRSDAGTVRFDGADITGLSVERRARVGLIRSFQDARLFPTLTGLETVQLALERTDPTRLLPELIGSGRRDARKRARADELIEMMGLTRYRDTQVSALSTGTRRITELACLIALEPTLLLLDEPSSGVAQGESEQLGELLLAIREHLDTTMIVIEHDIPLLMGLADRIVAMESGRVIASGTPDEVRNDERVIESYLGEGSVAVERSGASRTSTGGRCRALTRAGARCRRQAVSDGVCAQHASG